MGRITRAWIVAAAVGFVLPASASALYLQPAGRYPVPEPANQLALADLDGDGHVDLVTVGGPDSSGSPGVASVLHGNGDGSFGGHVDTQLLPGTSDFSPMAMAVADMNGDGQPDVVAAGTGTGGAHLAVLLNHAGTLSPGVGYSLSVSGVGGLAVRDLNADGRADVVLTTQTGTADVMLAQAGGGFGPPTGYSVSGTSWGLLTGPVTLADVNGDGKLDLLASGFNQADNSLSLSVRLGNGDGTFGSAQLSSLGPNGDSASAITVGDVNGDGKADIAVTYNQLAAAVLLGHGDGTFGAPQTILSGDGGDDIALADVDGDGHLDAVLDSGDNANILVVPGNGDGTFGSPVKTSFISGSVRHLALGDVNGDGLPDAVTLSGDYSGPTGRVAQVVSTAAAQPTASTDTVTGVSSSGATLQGTVNPRGQATTYWFQWGTSVAYGHVTPIGTLPAGSADVAVSAPIGGLPAGTVFHYRVVAQHGSGQPVYGQDDLFGTPPVPTPAGTAPTLLSPRIVLLDKTARQRTLEVKVGCASACRLSATELDVLASTSKTPSLGGVNFASSFEDRYPLNGGSVNIGAHRTGTLRVSIPLDAQTDILGTLGHGAGVQVTVELGSPGYPNAGQAQALLYQRPHAAKAKPKARKKHRKHRRSSRKGSRARAAAAAAGPAVYPVDPPLALNNGWERRGVRYNVQIHGSQVTSWTLDRQDIDSTGCVGYSRGQGTQVITFNSRKTLGVVAPMTFHGEEVLTTLDGSLPVDMVAGFSIDRSGSVTSGAAGPCRYVAAGGGSGAPQNDCGHRDQSGNVALDLNTGTATMWRDLWNDHTVGADAYHSCPFYGAYVPPGGANDLRLISVHHSGVPKILVRRPPKTITFTEHRTEVTHPQGANVTTEVTWVVTLTRAR